MEAEVVYRVYSPDRGLFVDFDEKESADKFRDEEYHGPIVIVVDGEEVGHY